MSTMTGAGAGGQNRTEQNRSSDLNSKIFLSFIIGPGGCRSGHALNPRKE